MAKQFPSLDGDLIAFIQRQHVFFVASGTSDSRINISPREIGALRILDDATVVYLDRAGSGNETAAHMLADGRLTIMLCAFDGPPRILRLYGRGRSIGWDTREFADLIDAEFEGTAPLGTRQIVCIHIELVQTSCGYGVPLFDYKADREAIDNWHNAKGIDGIKQYWDDQNRTSIDDLPTGLTVPGD